MKEELIRLAKLEKSPLAARNLAREYLQALILQSLQRAGAMTMLAFHGGTALRFIYSLPRYSEDLDFALERSSERYDFRAFLKNIRSDLETQGYTIELKVNDQKTVHSAFVRFPGLPYDLNLSPHRDEILAVKIEVDTNPPAGAELETTLIRRHVLLNLHHHDQSSLLSGKLHAILQRPYLKGRDLYDLTWYLSDKSWPPPNLVLLRNALAQTNWNGPAVTLDNWRQLVYARLESISWEQALEDVRPFLAATEELALLTRKNILQLLTPHS
jgi:predicted nucleotidyltransferase component of viral defense system